MNSAANDDSACPARYRYPWVEQYPSGVDWRLDIPLRPVQALFDDAVARFGARPFLDFVGRRYGYAQAARLIAKAALGFRRLGVSKGGKVGLFVPNSSYGVICYFAVLKAGGTVVNYSPLCAELELLRQIEDSDTDIMVTLDLEPLYGKTAVALARTRLGHAVICGMAEALPFPKDMVFRIAHRRELAKPPRDSRHLSFDDLIANDGVCEPAEIDPSADMGRSNTPAGRPASQKA